jgi:predicted O-methyltransferase YrrM
MTSVLDCAPLDPRSLPRLVAWPRWSDPDSVGRLLDLAEPVARDGSALLVLRHEPAHDGERDAALRAFRLACARRASDVENLEVLFDDGSETLDEVARNAEAVLRLGAEPDETWFAEAETELSSREDVVRWKARTIELDRVLARTEGRLSREEARLVYDAARSVQSGAIVGIGDARGRSTVALARGSRDGAGVPVHAIDPQEQARRVTDDRERAEVRARFLRALVDTDSADLVRHVDLPSADVALGWNRPVGLLALGGDHAYERVRRNFESWSKHLAPGAVILFEDATDPSVGPWTVIEELLARDAVVPVAAVGAVRAFRWIGRATTRR